MYIQCIGTLNLSIILLGRVTRTSVCTLLVILCIIIYTTIIFNLSRYASAISEMAIHNACRGAVQILGNPGNSQNQVSSDRL
jgi:hypothetical protein